jgi:hypothetical protein
MRLKQQSLVYYLKLLESEDLYSTHKTKPVLPDLSENIFFGNSLLNPSQVEKKNQTES